AAALRLDHRLLLSPAERHPASLLGCRLGLRPAHHLPDRLGGGDRHRAADPRRLDHRLLPDGGLLMDEVLTPAPTAAANGVRRSMRSDRARVRGLGAAKEGVGHWWAQRLTALALIPLGIWLVASVVRLAGADHAAIALWLGSPFTLGALTLTIITA